MTETSLREFLTLEIPEGLYLDYKEGLSGKLEKEAKREFLKDITAFANAAGGHLFYGVKEPAEGLTVDHRLVGLDEGESIAQALERLASTSCDPRIPGLRIVSVVLDSGKSCLAIHIPPSLSRPHMVNHQEHRSFYVRHSESSFPMTTHEIREAVLTSASAEGKARQTVRQRLEYAREVIGNQQAAFFIQAVPLIAPESQWDVLSPPFENVVRGGSRREKFKYFADLVSNIQPRPTIDGLLNRDDREAPNWEVEVHRTGYLSLLYKGIQTHDVQGVNQFVVHSGTCDIFRGFCHLLRELLEVSNTDVPYLLTCTYLNARGTCLWLGNRPWNRFSESYEKREIVWPEHVRSTGEDPMVIAENLALEMFHAFGFKEIID